MGKEALVRFLHARLEEDEERAQAATPGPWTQSGIGDYGWTVSFSRPGSGVETADGDQGRADADFIASYSPDRVLGEIAFKMSFLTEFVKEEWVMEQGHRTGWTEGGQAVRERLIRVWAASYAGHPAYQEAWRP
ncbi:MAG: hypothetical protein HOY79_04225 [Streptomyces sp.]|nr:hypothetical protein [Streptomyces sp.]NUS15412.1 hypothetical protein [Streptomyces sp.]NUS24006.1 hypothetical protein [Streptomyces sp.]